MNNNNAPQQSVKEINEEEEDEVWRFRDINWKQIWRRQDHAGMLLTLLLIVAVAVVSFAIDPRERSFLLYDATISYPVTSKHGFDPTVPDWVSIIVPLLMMLLTMLVGEFVQSRQEHRNITDAVAVMVYFIADALSSLTCALLVTQATKVGVGLLRPDFLIRCNPEIPDSVTLQYGNNTEGLYPCTGTDSDEIKDGKQSFPSGHSTFSFNLATYASGYLIWCWNMRRIWVPRYKGPWREFLSDLRNVAAKLWMLIMLSVAWGISMSRIIDNQHHAVDVLAGMVLGVLIAVLFILRAIPRVRRVLSPEETPENSNRKNHELELPQV